MSKKEEVQKVQYVKEVKGISFAEFELPFKELSQHFSEAETNRDIELIMSYGSEIISYVKQKVSAAKKFDAAFS